MYRTRRIVKVITESTTVKVENMGAWWFVNQGTADAVVDEVTYAPGEGSDAWAHLQPDQIWDSAIKVQCQSGAKVVLTYLLNKKVEK